MKPLPKHLAMLASTILLAALPINAAPPPLPPPPPAQMPAPKIVSRVSPIYPQKEICRNTGGTTKVLLNISGEGDVTNVSVAASSGNRELDRAALTAIRQWKFESTGHPSAGYVGVDFKPPSSMDDCLSYLSLGGLVGETPGYEAGTLEVRTNTLPPGSNELEIVILDSTGSVADQRTLTAAQVPGVVRFHGLKAGEHGLSLRVDGVELRRSTFHVLDNGSVATPPPAPPSLPIN